MLDIYMIVLSLCFLCSLVSWKYGYAWHMKLFSILLGITVITESLAIIVHKQFHRPNHAIYSWFMLFEYCLYALFFRLLLRHRRARRAIDIFLLVFPLAWAATTFLVFRLQGWNSYIILLGNVFTIILGLIFFYELFTSEELRNFVEIPEFWIVAATVSYSCCEIPITGMLNYLAVNYESVALKLKIVLQALNILLYLIIMVAFLLPLLIRRKAVV
jgi:hypothetical protein